MIKVLKLRGRLGVYGCASCQGVLTLDGATLIEGIERELGDWIYSEGLLLKEDHPQRILGDCEIMIRAELKMESPT